MSNSFSTDLIPVPDRQEAWLAKARQICGECKFLFPKRFPFHGSIERRKIADLEMTLFSSSPISFTKYPLAGLSSESRACIVISQLAGSRRYCQEDRVAFLRKGDTTLIDSGRPWTSDCPGDCARLYLRLPRRLMESRLSLSELPFARRFSGESGLGAIFYNQFGFLNINDASADGIDFTSGVDSNDFGFVSIVLRTGKYDRTRGEFRDALPIELWRCSL